VDKRILLIDLAIAWVPLFVLKEPIQVEWLANLHILVEQCLIQLFIQFGPLCELAYFGIDEG
jgi:hypothetical protein